jgi:prevent-host-death family protein
VLSGLVERRVEDRLLDLEGAHGRVPRSELLSLRLIARLVLMARRALSDFSDKLEFVRRMTATEVARNFSDVLNWVSAGEQIEITRNGATVAIIGPPGKTKVRFMSPERLREFIASMPPTDDDFIRDLEEIRRSVGPPPDIQWDS